MSKDNDTEQASAPSYWAVYLQCLQPATGERYQRVIMPPNEGGMYRIFRRHQPSGGSRVRWEWDLVSRRQITNQIFALAEWGERQPEPAALSPLVVCEITEKEFKDTHLDPKTPYGILRRLEKVARERHGMSI